MKFPVAAFAICGVLTIACWDVGQATSYAQQPKRKVPKSKVPNKIDGALWQFVATNRGGKQIRFRYRAADLVLHDPETNAVIGKSEGTTPGRIRVTFNSKSQFHCAFEMRAVSKDNPPVYRGQADYQDESWAVEVKGLVR